MTTNEFIEKHKHDDVRLLALQAAKHPEVDMTAALQQIEGWQIAQRKLPQWAATEGILYAKHLSMEQCSSETTAIYKALLVERLHKSQTEKGAEKGCKGLIFADFTGGFGVDFYYIARQLGAAEGVGAYEKMLFVEQQEELCRLAANNFNRLNIGSVKIVCSDATTAIDGIDNTSVVYLDPARRDKNGSRTYSIADCTPNVVEMQHKLTSKSRHVVVKLSPMLDYHKAMTELNDVREVHIVGAKGECKELLFVLSEKEKDRQFRLFCSVDGDTTSFSSDDMELRPVIANAIEEGMTLAEPTSCLMKTGAYGCICHRYGMSEIAQNSHLFVGEGDVERSALFRFFTITKVTTLNKNDLKTALSGLTHANISVRNFPMRAEQLRNKLRLKDGSDIYIFATTDQKGKRLLLVCKKKVFS